MHSRSSSLLGALVVALSQFAPQLSYAQETFQYVGPSGNQIWETPGNWTGGSGGFSNWPGESPEAGLLDSADLSGPLAADLDVQIAAPGFALDILTLGTTTGFFESVISGADGATLSVNEIHPRGSVFAQNRIAADLLLARELLVGNALSSLVIDGRLIYSGAGQRHDVSNGAGSSLPFNGEVLLSEENGSRGHFRFINSSSGDIAIRGAISDGPVSGGQVTYVRGLFTIHAENTYSGTTTIGDNDPNVETTIVIHNDSPFGTGRVVIGGGNAMKTIRAAFGGGTRTLSNDLRIAREVEFVGNESIVLNGDVWQSNGRQLTNNIALGELTINGDIYAADSNDVREWVFGGLGQTIVSGIIDDSLGHPLVDGASVAKRGSGRVILTNPAVAAYGGATRVLEGVLQLGNGGPAVDLNSGVVSGDGELEINHSGVLDFSAAATDSLTIRHSGSGVTRLTRVSNGDGELVITDGVLLANSGEGGSSATGSGSVTVFGGELAGFGHVGGAVSVRSGGTLAPGDGVGKLGLGALDLRSGATFAVEIGGPSSGSDFDAAQVVGSAQLGGDLTITLNNYQPSGNDVFDILTSGSLSGELANAPTGSRLETTDGAGSFLVTYDGVAGLVTLSDFEPATLEGDFNADGVVDAVDYGLWRDNLGAPDETALNGAGDGINGIDRGDFLLWKSNYGHPAAGSGLQGHAPLPEPTAALLMVLGACLLPVQWRRELL